MSNSFGDNHGIVGDVRIKTKSGETFIAASQRPDGTWRKARRVKNGYIPQEEQPRYESRGMQQSKQSKYPVGLNPIDAPRKSLRAETVTGPVKPIIAIEKPNAAITPKDHIEKKINNLNRKLRDIEVLKEKIASGKLVTPEKTQLEKIARKEAIEDEIAKLTEQLNSL
uniref:Partner of Y14 and mago n=1 Tax=Syphacia muris TaxID=451379 RepID=A0A0N5AFJ0_9BILA